MCASIGTENHWKSTQETVMVVMVDDSEQEGWSTRMSGMEGTHTILLTIYLFVLFEVCSISI